MNKKKVEYKGVFPTVITKTNKYKYDLNWLYLGKGFRKEVNFWFADKIRIVKPEIKNPTVFLEKLYEKYCVLWDFYINKQYDMDINQKLKDIDEYGR